MSTSQSSLRVDGSNFSAWIDSMPGSPKKLIVVGDIEVPTLGWSWSLKEASPQGIVPEVKILDLDIHPPSGMAGQQISQIKPRYEEEPPKQNYTDITIRYAGVDFTISVGATS